MTDMLTLKREVTRTWHDACANAHLFPAALFSQMGEVFNAMHGQDSLTIEQLNVLNLVQLTLSEEAYSGTEYIGPYRCAA